MKKDRDEIPAQWKVRYEEPLNEALSNQLDPLFANPNGETWAEVRKLLAHETESVVSKLLADISELELDPEKSNKMVEELRDYGRNVVKRKAREVSVKVHQRMKVRFAFILNDALVRRKAEETTIKDACIECLKLLSVMVAIRLDAKPVKLESKVFAFSKEKLDKYDEKTQSSSIKDHIQNKILGLSKDVMGRVEQELNSSTKEKQDEVIEKMLISSLLGKKLSKNALDSSTWPEVSPEDTLIKPAECKLLWEYFQAEILPQTLAFISGQAAGEQASASYMNFGAAIAGINS